MAPGWRPVTALIANLVGSLGDLLLPPSCAVCGALLDHHEQTICPECLLGFQPLLPPVCDCCGQPYAGLDLCPECRCYRSPCEKIRSLFVFGGSAQEAILRLKLAGKLKLASFFGRQLATASFPGLNLKEQDLLVPVPLHRIKLAKRGFNQSAMVGDALSKLTGMAHAPYHLLRRRPTLSQSRMRTKAERAQNVRGAFGVTRKHPFAGKRLCLLDDVATTGSTLAACATALLEAGAKRVVAVTIARALPW